MLDMRKCAFTGHRPQKLPFGSNESDERCITLKHCLHDLILRLIIERNVRHFISGMAIGTDMYAAEIILDLKKDYPDLILEAAIPCLSQDEKWTADQRKRYADLLSKCDKQTLIQKDYTDDCMMKRNYYMVDEADYLIAVWDGRPSGTGKTVNYAIKRYKPILAIDPKTMNVTCRKPQ